MSDNDFPYERTFLQSTFAAASALAISGVIAWSNFIYIGWYAPFPAAALFGFFLTLRASDASSNMCLNRGRWVGPFISNLLFLATVAFAILSPVMCNLMSMALVPAAILGFGIAAIAETDTLNRAFSQKGFGHKIKALLFSAPTLPDSSNPDDKQEKASILGMACTWLAHAGLGVSSYYLITNILESRLNQSLLTLAYSYWPLLAGDPYVELGVLTAGAFLAFCVYAYTMLYYPSQSKEY